MNFSKSAHLAGSMRVPKHDFRHAKHPRYALCRRRQVSLKRRGKQEKTKRPRILINQHGYQLPTTESIARQKTERHTRVERSKESPSQKRYQNCKKSPPKKVFHFLFDSTHLRTYSELAQKKRNTTYRMNECNVTCFFVLA